MPRPNSGAARAAGIAAVGVAIASLIAGCGSDGGLAQPMPTRHDEQALRDYLAKAADAQGICYGWQLRFDNRYSSTGTGTSSSPPQGSAPCTRSVTLSVSVTWTSSSSESADSASVRLHSTPNLAGKLPATAALSNAGINAAGFVDDPGGELDRSLRSLPLLLSESAGVATVPQQSTPSSVDPPAQVGSDRWRAHGTLVILGGIALLIAVLVAIGGTVALRRRRSSVPEVKQYLREHDRLGPARQVPPSPGLGGQLPPWQGPPPPPERPQPPTPAR
ncbi:MAG: hypothetical protein ACRDRN_24570 [Sciscionella sp.]